MIRIVLLGVLAILILGAVGCAPGETVGQYPTTSAIKSATTARQPWESEWEKTLDAARQEKTVVIYTTAGAEIRTVFTKALKEKYGLELEFITGRFLELTEKLFAERRAGLYIPGFYMGGFPLALSTLVPAGALDPIRPELILPEVTDTKNWYGDKLPFVDRGEYFLGFRGAVFRPVTINTTFVKPEEIVSYEDLLKPKFKGKIAMGDPTAGGASASFITMTGEYLFGYDFIRELARQEPFFSRDERLLTEWVARGKYHILIGTKPDPIAEFEKAGAPLLSIVPKEGSFIESGAGTICVFNKRPNPNAARVFLNWLLTREGQTLYAQAAGVESAREDVSKAHLDPGLRREPGKKYILADEEWARIHTRNVDLSKELFGALLK